MNISGTEKGMRSCAVAARLVISLCLVLGSGSVGCYHSAHHESDIQDDPDSIEDPGLEPELDQVDPLPETSDPDLDVTEEIDIPPEPENTWIRVYSGEVLNIPSHVRATSDGGYAFAASGYRPEGGLASAIVKLDSEGVFQWARMFGQGRPEVHGLVQTPDRGFGLLIMEERVEELTPPRLVKLDENGNLLWALDIEAEVRGELTSLENTREGGFVLGGSAYLSDIANVWMVLLDEHGFVIWDKDVYGITGYFSLQAVAQAEDGGFGAAGTMRLEYPDDDRLDSWVVKLDASGNISWGERISGSHELEPYAIAPAPGNGFVIGGKGGYSYYGALASGPFIMRLDEDGTILWQKIFKDTSEGEILGLCPAHGGGFVGAGMTIAGITGYDGTLLKILDDGTVAWIRGYSTRDYDKFHHVDQTQDGGFVATGPTLVLSPIEPNPWVVKTNSDGGGMTGCPEGLGIEMTLTVEDTDFAAASTSAWPEDSGVEVTEIDLATEEIEVEVETICEGE
jgi:hypothetical protein